MKRKTNIKTKKRFTNADLGRLITNLDQKFTGKFAQLDQKFTKQIYSLAQNQLKMKSELGELKQDIQITEKNLTQIIENSQDQVIAVIQDVIEISSNKYTVLEKRVAKLEQSSFAAN